MRYGREVVILAVVVAVLAMVTKHREAPEPTSTPSPVVVSTPVLASTPEPVPSPDFPDSVTRREGLSMGGLFLGGEAAVGTVRSTTSSDKGLTSIRGGPVELNGRTLFSKYPSLKGCTDVLGHPQTTTDQHYIWVLSGSEQLRLTRHDPIELELSVYDGPSVGYQPPASVSRFSMNGVTLGGRIAPERINGSGQDWDRGHGVVISTNALGVVTALTGNPLKAGEKVFLPHNSSTEQITKTLGTPLRPLVWQLDKSSVVKLENGAVVWMTRGHYESLH